ncbi:MAG: MBL fold metallo-hydrolase [Candidatus Parvarchaeota archaeon]|jgi:L-ascorbate metabolism protein UlaG (beta-lactamase superfamily)|nr:MBL fold metallo-hydrolase [Candidatus Parvarchaeota archaeon]MCL5106903.1 MBL fold metallo-hydrolase [Candidatus Parvarchaeota archaeon]
MIFQDINIEWLHHACFRVTGKTTIIYTDPYKVIKDYNNADIILITHDHYDHLDNESIKKLANEKTVIVAPKDCESLLGGFNNKKVFVSPNEVKIVKDITIKTVPSYNINKFNEKGLAFHPKEKGNVGYIFIVDNVKVYIAGDTDNIPEMESFKTDIALLPVSGIYVMLPKEAAEAALKIKPEIAIPMHYGSGIGTEKEAREFKRLLQNKLRVEILTSVDK